MTHDVLVVALGVAVFNLLRLVLLDLWRWVEDHMCVMTVGDNGEQCRTWVRERGIRLCDYHRADYRGDK